MRRGFSRVCVVVAAVSMSLPKQQSCAEEWFAPDVLVNRVEYKAFDESWFNAARSLIRDNRPEDAYLTGLIAELPEPVQAMEWVLHGKYVYVAGNDQDGGYIQAFSRAYENHDGRSWNRLDRLSTPSMPRLIGYAHTNDLNSSIERLPPRWATGIYLIQESDNQIVQYNAQNNVQVEPLRSIPGPREIVGIYGDLGDGAPLILTHNEGGGASIVSIDTDLGFSLVWESDARDLIPEFKYLNGDGYPVPGYLVVPPVPEPASIALWLGCAIMLVFPRNRSIGEALIKSVRQHLALCSTEDIDG